MARCTIEISNSLRLKFRLKTLNTRPCLNGHCSAYVPYTRMIYNDLTNDYLPVKMGYFRFADKPHSTVNNTLYVLELFSKNKKTQYYCL